MRSTSGQFNTGTPPTEESDPLAEITHLTGYELKLLDNFHKSVPLSRAPSPSSPPTPSLRFCRCGRPQDPLEACSRAGLLGRRGFAVESAGARVCREAGGRVGVNVMVRDMDLALPNPHDATGWRSSSTDCPVWRSATAIDTTLVSPVRGDGTARPGNREHQWHHPSPGSAQKRVYILGVGRSPFVCAPCGLWSERSEETQSFLRILGRAKARSEPPILRKRVEQAWRMRWAATRRG